MTIRHLPDSCHLTVLPAPTLSGCLQSWRCCRCLGHTPHKRVPGHHDVDGDGDNLCHPHNNNGDVDDDDDNDDSHHSNPWQGEAISKSRRTILQQNTNDQDLKAKTLRCKNEDCATQQDKNICARLCHDMIWMPGNKSGWTPLTWSHVLSNSLCVRENKPSNLRSFWIFALAPVLERILMV